MARKAKHNKRRYAKILLIKRERLVYLVEIEKMSIARAGRKLNLRPSTAKLIMKKYRETGLFTLKKIDLELLERSQAQVGSEASELEQLEEEVNQNSPPALVQPQPIVYYNNWTPSYQELSFPPSLYSGQWQVNQPLFWLWF